MSTQTKRPAGRPKAQPQAEAVEPAVTETVVKEAPAKKKASLKRKVVENTNVEFKTTKPSGVVYMLPQKGVTIYDEEKDTVREIRFCPNEPSIFVDEQSDKALKQSVIFREGRLFVRKDQPNLRKFLEMHPGNSENGGKLFEKIDLKKDAEDTLNKEFLLNDAVTMVRDKDIQELLPVALFYGININKPTSEIRYNLLTVAKKNPKEFIDSFDNPRVRARSILKQATEYQMIRMKPDGVYWFDSNGLIVSVPHGQDAMDIAVRFCLTEKGSSVLDTLQEKLDRLG